MSARISYKKQFVFGLMLLAVLLVVVEGFVNIWWNEIITCAFENNELFEDFNENSKKQLCLENLELQFTKTGIKTQQGTFININSEGFRGSEFNKEKPENTFRIFVVGGSSTFGSGVFDYESPPAFLQTKFGEQELDFNVEVINAGIPGISSGGESVLIKTRLINYDPDLFVIYDGANELGHRIDPVDWQKTWTEICKLKDKHNFEIIITLQPLAGTGNRISTEQEYQIYLDNDLENYLKPYPLFAEQLLELNLHCSKTADLRNMFDDILDPVFFDRAHVNALGNEIVADNLFKLSFPLVLENSNKIKNLIEKNVGEQEKTKNNSIDEQRILDDIYLNFEKIISSYKTPKAISHFPTFIENQFLGQGIFLLQNPDSNQSLKGVNLSAANLTNWDFSGMNLNNAIFYNADLTNANFQNANLEGADLSFAKMNGANFEGANLKGANLSHLDLSNTDLVGLNLSYASLIATDLSWSNLSKINFYKANLTGTNLVGANLEQANLEGVILFNADLSLANLSGVELINAKIIQSDFTLANLKGSNLANSEIINTTMHLTDFTKANLQDTKIINSNFYGSNFKDANVNLKELQKSGFNCNNNIICN